MRKTLFCKHPEENKKENIMYGIEFSINSAFSASEKQHKMRIEKILLLASSGFFSRIQYAIMSAARKETDKQMHIKLQSRYLCF